MTTMHNRQRAIITNGAHRMHGARGIVYRAYTIADDVTGRPYDSIEFQPDGARYVVILSPHDLDPEPVMRPKRITKPIRRLVAAR